MLYFVYKKLYVMRMNIEFDDELVKKAFHFSRAKTKRELIQEALEELIAACRQVNRR